MSFEMFGFKARKGVIFALLGAPLLTACAGPNAGTDPYEGVNRQIYQFNLAADRVAIRPLSNVYGAVPSPVRTSISNFGDNLDQPRSVVNDVLQGNSEDAVHNTFRFLINTTVGVGGLFDPATSFGLEDRETGFADTLSVWGVGAGAYQVLPLLGPSTERDTVGYAVDILLNPLDAIAPDDVADASLPATTLEVLNERFVFRTTIDNILYDSADGYEQLRIFYLDSRRFELGEAPAEDDFFDPYEDF